MKNSLFLIAFVLLFSFAGRSQHQSFGAEVSQSVFIQGDSFLRALINQQQATALYHVAFNKKIKLQSGVSLGISKRVISQNSFIDLSTSFSKSITRSAFYAVPLKIRFLLTDYNTPKLWQHINIGYELRHTFFSEYITEFENESAYPVVTKQRIALDPFVLNHMLSFGGDFDFRMIQNNRATLSLDILFDAKETFKSKDFYRQTAHFFMRFSLAYKFGANTAYPDRIFEKK